ncbi:MAG: threonine/serine dehydratase [Eubacterium sp.]|nr:threonine/serine dehydratase [Eubacterium sp.]
MENEKLTLQDVLEAAKRIRPYVRRTPLLREQSMDETLDCQVYVKPEMLQVSGSFKMRGASNKILSLSEEERKCGIITSSSGNHGRACALLGQMTGTRVAVVLPEDTPSRKIEVIRSLGAEVILGPREYPVRWQLVEQQVAEHGYIIVHAYEDYKVMAGQGTIGLEILEDLPYIDTIIVPIGGGGLISGISTVLKTLRPEVRIIGVQAENSDPYVESRKAGHPVVIDCRPTIADGLTGRRPGVNPYPIIDKNVDELVAVPEDAIAGAVRLTADRANLIAEPSSCVGIAALLSGRVQVRPDERVAFVLTSGNWDNELIGRILLGETVEGVL